MSLTVEFTCSNCHDPFSAYRPSRDTIERPLCPSCLIGTFEGMRRLYNRLAGKENETTAARVPQEN